MGKEAYLSTEAYYGKPWIWSIVHDFGGTVTLHASLPAIINRFGGAMKSPNRGRLSGLGPIMESLGYNAVFYDLFTDVMWRSEVPELEPWVMQFIHRRYGRESARMQEAWKLLLQSAYGDQGGAGDVVCLRPSLTG